MLEHLAQKEDRGRETVTLDDLTVRELAKTDPKMFFQLHKRRQGYPALSGGPAALSGRTAPPGRAVYRHPP